MNSAKSRTPLIRLLTASALSLALLGGITACAPASKDAGDGNHGPSVATTTAAPARATPTATTSVDPNAPDANGDIHGYITEMISSQVVRFTPSRAKKFTELTGKEPSFLVLMDGTGPNPDYICDDAEIAKRLEILITNSQDSNYSKGTIFTDTNAGQLNDKGQRQGKLQVTNLEYSVNSMSRTGACYRTPQK